MISSKLVILAIVSSVLAAPAPQLITIPTISSVPELTSTTSATFIPSTVSPSGVGVGTTTLDSSPISSLAPPTSVPQISGISTTAFTLPGTILTSATGVLPSGECSDVPSVITVTETVSATSDIGAYGDASSVVSTVVTNDIGSTVLLSSSTASTTVAITDSTGVVTTVSVSATAPPSEVTSSFGDVSSGVVSSFTGVSSGVVSLFTEEPSSELTSSIATF